MNNDISRNDILKLINSLHVIAIPMSALKSAYGFKRLGVHACERISQMLVQDGLNHTPKKLPADHKQVVFLYNPKSLVGEMIEAIVNPTKLNTAFLSNLLAKHSPALDKLDKIKALVEI